MRLLREPSELTVPELMAGEGRSKQRPYKSLPQKRKVRLRGLEHLFRQASLSCQCAFSRPANGGCGWDIRGSPSELGNPSERPGLRLRCRLGAFYFKYSRLFMVDEGFIVRKNSLLFSRIFAAGPVSIVGRAG